MGDRGTGRWLRALGAGLLSGVLLAASFPVPDWFPLAWVGLGQGCFPLAWVALVPWFVVLRESGGGAALLGSVAMGLCAAGLGVSWQYLVTVAGGAGLTVYLAAYFVLFAWLVRAATARLRVPFVVAAPLVWVGCEHLRSFLITGLPWLFVGHTQHGFTTLVQVCDLFGAYAVSFVVVAANAFAAELVVRLRREPVGWLGLVAGGAFVAAMAAALVGYGSWRLGRLANREGPLVGIVQGDIPQEVKNQQTLESIQKIVLDHCRLTRGELREAARGRQLDLIVWPESMVQLPLNRDDYPVVRAFREQLLLLAREMGCPILVGAHAEIGTDLTIAAEADGAVGTITDGEILVGDRAYLLPHYEDPVTGERPIRRIAVREGQSVRRGDTLADYESIVHNSAYLFRPAREFDPADRYDKNHLVPFGEYMPLGGLLWFLRTVVPYGKGFSPSDRLNALEVGDVRFGVLICFESIFPRLVRRYIVRPEGPPADFLVNISNDGWFQGSHELDQHLAICAFRAIEFRTGIVRSVNRGISAIIDPAGRVAEIVRDKRGRTKLTEGVAVGRVQLRDGLTFYARHGDIFARLCLLFAAIVFVSAIVPPVAARLRRRSAE